MANQSISIRLAKPSDSGYIAKLHYEASREQPGAFIFKLGPNFIKAYYSITMNEPHNILLCSESSSGEILGFISGSTDSQEHLQALKAHWIKLGFSALTSFIIRPGLLLSAWKRFRFLKGDRESTQFCATTGARIEYWGWKKNDPHAYFATNMLGSILTVMKSFGVTRVFGEVDEENTRLVKMHKLMGCEKIADLGIVDGRTRSIYVHDLEKKSNWRG